MTICVEDACSKPAERRGMCHMHYGRVRRAGLLPAPPSIEQRFWSHVDRSGGPEECWPWTGARDEHGYGRTRQTHASRLAYEYVVGPIPDGHVIRHGCDYPPCCNPAHLTTGTNKQNTADMVRRGRGWWQGQTHCKRGHEFTPENTMPIAGSEWRRCRECHRRASRERKRRLRAQARQLKESA